MFVRYGRNAGKALAWIALMAVVLTGCAQGQPPTSTPTLSGPLPTRTASQAMKYGVDLNLGQHNIGAGQLAQALRLATQAGITYVRSGIAWATIQAAGPDTYNWTALDQLAQMARSNHTQLLLSVGDDTPAWDLPPEANGNSAYPPADCTGGAQDCASFGTFVGQVVAHVAPLGVRYIVLRNEPQNRAKNWVNGTPDEYARFVHAAYVAAHQANSAIVVLNGGEELWPATLQTIMNKYRANLPGTLQFVTSLYANPLFCKSIDVLDVHAGFHGPAFAPQIVDLSEQALRRCNGGVFVPVWVTETAYPADQGAQTQPQINDELGSAYAHGTASQADFLTATYTALYRDANVTGVNWTFLVDPPNAAPGSDAAGGLGLADASFKPRPAYAALQHFIAAYP
jgi:hypothetical protein